MSAAPPTTRPLPPAWRWARLGDVCDIVVGRTPSRSEPSYWNGDLPWCKISDLDNDPVQTTRERITGTGASASRSRLIPAGTLLFSFKLTIGKMAFAGIDLYTNEAIAGLIPRDGVDSEFLRHALSTVDAYGDSQHAVKGKTLNQDTLRPLPIPLPPLPEQRRVAAVLRDQLGAVRRAREAARARLEAARALPAAVLRSVFESDEAKLWPKRRIGEFAKTASGTTPSREVGRYYGGTIPWVKTMELQDSTIFETNEYVTNEALQETSLRLLPEGTLLVAMYGQGQTRGRTAILGVEATINQACFAVLPDPRVFDNAFLRMWFRHNYGRLREESEGRGGNQPNLNGIVLREQLVAMPDSAVQGALATDFQDQLLLASRVQAVAEAELALIDSMPQSLLRQAFAGEL